MAKLIRKKHLNIDSNYLNKNNKNNTIFIFINIKNIRINNINKKLLHNTNFLLKKEKLYSVNKTITIDKIGNYLKKNFKLKDSTYYQIYNSEIKIYLVLLDDNEKDIIKNNIKLNKYEWRKFIDVYNIKDPENRDINKYFNIINESFNSHIYKKLYTDTYLGNTYIKLISIYKKLCIHYESNCL